MKYVGRVLESVRGSKKRPERDDSVDELGGSVRSAGEGEDQSIQG